MVFVADPVQIVLALSQDRCDVPRAIDAEPAKPARLGRILLVKARKQPAVAGGQVLYRLERKNGEARQRRIR